MEQAFIDNPLLSAYHFIGFCFFSFLVSRWVQDLKLRILSALEVGLSEVRHEIAPASAEREFNRVRFSVEQELKIRLNIPDVVVLFVVWFSISWFLWPLLVGWQIKEVIAAWWRNRESRS
jgi:hypothetical protein